MTPQLIAEINNSLDNTVSVKTVRRPLSRGAFHGRAAITEASLFEANIEYFAFAATPLTPNVTARNQI